jgi:hypothetical protein
MFIARRLSDRAMKYLSPGQRLGLIDLFAKDRKYTYAIMFSIIILFLVALQFHWVPPLFAFGIYVFLVITYISIKSFRTYTILTKHYYPTEYISATLGASTLAAVGMLVFFILIATDYFL